MTEGNRAAVTAVLWDIDGTLLSSGGVAAGSFLDAIADVTGTRPDGRNLDLGGRIDPEIAGALLRSINAEEGLVPTVLSRLRDLAEERKDLLHAAVSVFPGVLEILTRLGEAGVRQTVVTGNIESVGRMKLDAAGVVPPIDADLAGYGDHGSTRLEVAQAAVDRLIGAGWTGSLDQCWIVGDTPRDLACARELGVRCALVATGRHSFESMSGLGADVLISGFHVAEELHSVWGLET